MAVLAPSGAAQTPDPSSSSSTAPPAPTTTVDRAARSELSAQINALENQLTDLDGAIPQKEATVVAAQAAVQDVEGRIAANAAAIEANIEAHVAPQAAREELVLALYTGGPSELRSFSDFVRNGTISGESLRRDRLFQAAEEGARDTLARLDAERVQLDGEQVALQAERDQAIAAVGAAQADLDAAVALRAETERALDQARADLKALLALSARSPMTGAVDYPIRPAIGVKIDNGIDARPQTGLTKADVVYDIIVEGGITRFLAMFQSQDAARIGPVRSARTSDISIMAGYNTPVFAYSGGNNGVLAAVRVAPMISLTEATTPRAFVRDESRFAPHNLYTSTAGLYSAGGDDAGVPISQFVFRQAGEPSAQGRPVSGATINIGFETVTYSWNGRTWDRATNGRPTEDTTAGTVSPENVIVQFTNYATSPADAQSPDAQTVGQGTAWVLTDGKVIEARWARSIATTPVQYLDATNTQIPLTPGQTWVELPTPGNASVG
ncbi:MAG: DUF3048 domain-containing protein [Acidimicrobiales bacterium]|nr:DUF3048 domain-containing protein [Acidimicrobiales bacterium]